MVVATVHFSEPQSILSEPQIGAYLNFLGEAQKIEVYTDLGFRKNGLGFRKMDCGHHYRCIVPVPLQASAKLKYSPRDLGPGISQGLSPWDFPGAKPLGFPRGSAPGISQGRNPWDFPGA